MEPILGVNVDRNEASKTSLSVTRMTVKLTFFFHEETKVNKMQIFTLLHDNENNKYYIGVL